MKTLKAIWNWLRGIDNKVAEGMKDPINDRKLAIEDAKKAANSFRMALASSMSQVSVMEAELSKLTKNSEKYANLAKVALTKGNEVDATNLLIEQEKFEKKIKALTIDLENEQKFILKNRQLLEKETDKISEAESQTGRLEARSKAADNRKKLSSLRDSESFKALDAFEDTILANESFAESLDELNTDPSEALEDKYESEAASESVQERLARLKSEINQPKAV